MDKKVIMVSGNIDHGKDFLADLFMGELSILGITAEKISTARELKEQICNLFRITPEFLDYHKNQRTPIVLPDKKTVFNFRTFIQDYGTLMREKRGFNVWADHLLNDIFNSKAEVIIVPDLRYPFEYDTIKAIFNTTTVRIVDDNIPVDYSHSSETSMVGFDFDYVVNNTGRPKSTIDASTRILKWILNGR
jgi:hypothetical protein